VLIEYSEWLLRVEGDQKVAVESLLRAADILIDIEQDNEEDDEKEEKGSTIFSRNSRNKQSSMSRQLKSSAKKSEKSSIVKSAK